VLPTAKYLVLAPLLTFNSKLVRLGKLYPLQKMLFNADLNLGLLFLFAISSLRSLWHNLSWLGK
jgi:NADH:ubiquinone oxidoreductase subunit H